MLIGISAGIISKDYRKLRRILEQPPAVQLSIQDREGKLIYRQNMTSAQHRAVTLEELPVHFLTLLLESEDKKFYSHIGFDIGALFRAVLRNIRRGGSREGGSTITQQLVKIKLGEPKRTLPTKLKEIVLAMVLDGAVTKEKILNAYVNSIYFGHNLYGIEAAARFYLDKSARDLSATESAFLIVMIPHPGYGVSNNTDGLFILQKALLDRAAPKLNRENGTNIGEVEEFQQKYRFPTSPPSSTPAGINRFPYLSAHVLGFVRDELGVEQMYSRDLTVRTTFSNAIQQEAQTTLTDYVRTVLFSNLTGLPDPPLEGAIIILEPSSGSLLAIVGGADSSRQSEFNRATATRRRIASTIKPFLYATAFENTEYDPWTEMQDEPVSVVDAVRGSFAPQNHYFGYRGKVTLERALAESINTVSLSLVDEMGVNASTRGISRFFVGKGLSLQKAQRRFEKGFGVALGAAFFSLYELSRAYAVLAASGVRIDPFSVESIIDGRGEVMYRHHPEGTTRVIDENITREVNRSLQQVFSFGGTAYPGVTEPFRFSLAGKSGTIADNSWFVGFSPQYLIGIWIGMDHQRHKHVRDIHYSATSVFFSLARAIHPEDYVDRFPWEELETENPQDHTTPSSR